MDVTTRSFSMNPSASSRPGPLLLAAHKEARSRKSQKRYLSTRSTSASSPSLRSRHPRRAEKVKEGPMKPSLLCPI